MWKQLLAYTLAFCLAFEAPATVYAAEQNGLTEEVNLDSTNALGGGNNPEESDVTDASTLEGTDEAVTDENIRDSEETDLVEDETGEDDENDTDVPDSSEEQTDTEDVSEEDVENGEDSDVLDVETGVDAEADTKAEAVLPAQAANVKVTEIDYNKASSEAGFEGKVPYMYGDTMYAYYSFTAPEDGDFLFYFYIDDTTSVSDYTYVQLFRDLSQSDYYGFGNFNSNDKLNLVSGEMKKGETVYLRMYSGVKDGQTFTLKIAKLGDADSVEEGSSTVSVGDSSSITVTPTVGCKTLRIDAKLNTNDTTGNENYQVYMVFWNRDTDYYSLSSYNKIELSSAASPDDRTSNYTTATVNMGSDYDVYYIIRDNSGKLLTCFAEKEPLHTIATDEPVYFFEDKTTIEEHKITLRVEPIASNPVICYYAPADSYDSSGNSKEERSRDCYSNLSDLEFSGLKSGTEYTFRFCQKYSGKVYTEKKYTTLGTTVTVPSVEYTANLSEDFTTLTLTANIEGYTGSATSAELHYRFVDALGVEKTGSSTFNPKTASSVTISIPEETEYEGGRGSDGNMAAFLADTEYKIEMWLSFPEDHLTLEAETYTVKTPESDYSLKSIDFTIEEGDLYSQSVELAVTVDEDTPEIDSVIFYKLQNGLEYASSKCYVENSDGTPIGYITPGDYEFILFIGGVKIVKTYQVKGDSDVSLVKVDSGKNEVGAYDFVRTLKVEANESGNPDGTYYLHLEYAAEDRSYYFNADKSIALDAENGYQATAYSVDLIDYNGLKPDTDYYLRWTLCSISGYCQHTGCTTYYEYCETIHTKPAKLKVSVESNACTSGKQVYKVTLDPADVVNMKTYNRSAYVNGYVKKTGADEKHYAFSRSCYLTRDNDYSATLELRDLEAETEYDLRLLGDYDAILYETTFTTLPDSRKLSNPMATVTSAKTQAVLSAYFEGNSEIRSSYINFFYREKDGEDQTWKKEGSVNATNYINGSISMTLKDLEIGKEYEYAIALSEQDNLTNPDPVSGNWKVTGEFNTIPALPTKITLSQSEIYLNAAFADVDGVGKKQLKVTYEPANASNAFVWKSSDDIVATVSEDGLVTAVGSGEATITVSSRYAKEGEKPYPVTCKVVVGSYKIGYTESDSDTIHLMADGEELQLYKGDDGVDNYKLFAIDGDNTTPVSEFHVDSTNPQVVTWEPGKDGKSGVIKAGNVGSANLIFVAGGGVCTYLPVTVSARGKGFDILDFEPEDNYAQYPAIKEDAAEDGNAQYTLAYAEGITYTAVGEISPHEDFVAGNFEWTITGEGTDAGDESKAAVATVENGVITPNGPGTVKLTVTADKDYYNIKTRTIILNFKALPEQVLNEAKANVYALANIHTKIGDVEFPGNFADEKTEEVYWEWKYPNTPLVTNGINADSYPFEAVYTGEKYYPCEAKVNVYVAKVTDVSVSDDHNKVVEVKGSEGTTADDKLVLKIRTGYQGKLNTSAYQEYNYTLIGLDVNEYEGLNIKQPTETDTSGTYEYEITATKAGTYTLKPVIQVEYTDSKGKDQKKKLASATYKIKAVENPQAKSIDIKLAEGTKTDVVTIGEDGVYTIDVTGKEPADIKKIEFDLRADVKDQLGNSLEETNLTWKTSDSSVATVKAATNTHEATVSVKGEGHAVLTAVAKDDAGCVGTLKIEIQNYEPRVSVSKVTVNPAFDYEDSEGYGLNLAAASSGAVEIVPAYGNDIRTVAIYDEDYAENKTVSEKFQMVNRPGMNQWVVAPKSGVTLSNGTYSCTLHVTTSKDTYDYPLSVTVNEKKATVTAKSVKTANLFYTADSARIKVNISGTNDGIKGVSWLDNSDADASHGFIITAPRSGEVSFNQGGAIEVKNGKLVDTDIVKGTLKIKLYGYKGEYPINNVSIKWNYKKPSIVTQSTSTTLIPSAGKTSASFELYHKTDKENILYHPAFDSAYKYYCNDVVCDNANVILSQLEEDSSSVTYFYTGNKSKGSEKIDLTLKSKSWRESLNVTHTIKFATPTAYLSVPTVTINTTHIGTESTAVLLKNAYDADLNCNDIVIKGKDQKAEELLTYDLLEIYQDQNDKSTIIIKQNRAQTMSNPNGTDSHYIKDGTYTYNVTPYYTDDQGNRKALKTLTLKVKATSKAVTAKTKTSGSLDLVQQSTASSNNIKLTPAFSNLGNSYTVNKTELCGEYSEYFNLAKYDDSSSGYAYLTIKDYSKLKSGQNYKLSVRYTIKMADGDTFTVTGANFTVKPKQTTPKVTIGNNNQVLYAGSTISRTYTLSLPSTYTIESVSGSLDCNKDGTPDIEVTGTTKDYYSTLTVSVADRDGLVASAKGKTYSIPLTVKLQGADGISKDVKTTIKVIVKR